MHDSLALMLFELDHRLESSRIWYCWHVLVCDQFWCMVVALRSTFGSTSWALKQNSKMVSVSQTVQHCCPCSYIMLVFVYVKHMVKLQLGRLVCIARST